MRQMKLTNNNKNIVKNIEKNDKLPITPRSPEDSLNTLTDIIIERIIEERNKNNNHE